MLNLFHCRPDVSCCNFSATEPYRNNHNLVTILLIFAGSRAVTDTGGKTISPKHEQNTSKYTNEQDQPPTYDQALRQCGEHPTRKTHLTIRNNTFLQNTLKSWVLIFESNVLHIVLVLVLLMFIYFSFFCYNMNARSNKIGLKSIWQHENIMKVFSIFASM